MPAKRSTLVRFWEKVDIPDDAAACWEWTASRYGSGYGQFRVSVPENRAAHRFAYELLRGPIPEGMVLDHLCRNRGCVNPDHLEVVTNTENVRRGARGRMVTVCAQGHPYTPENTYVRPEGRRNCRTCKRARDRAFWARVRRERLAREAAA